MTKPVYILNGPNLNMLGSRETEIYGSQTLEDISSLCTAKAQALGLSIDFRQTNDEGELVNQVQEARENASAIILNAAAYTHTSVALHDALAMADVPIIEVHLSNVYKREEFRHKSFVSPVAQGVICGFGAQGYELALDAARKLI
ncbi:3-dehydroquinate dehydratase II [hydrothermal vent metagenome]|uniref:3-dehydroquinate dehydratase n=1 Tax=hydrothermal vent metagenome TaxID=652676 RepID=A0A3B0RH22_9ZZZZ